jgi:tubulin polyglutamylase TTLL6/13
MYGFDIILDHKLKPWLLEINVLPSLSASSKMDRRIKTSLMADIFGIIGIIPYSKKRLDKLEEDSKWQRFSGIPKA